MPRWKPSLWAGFIPNGIGQVKPNHYLEMAKAIWQNKDQLPYAWRIDDEWWRQKPVSRVY